MLPALAQAQREDIRKLSAYEERTAGALMTSDYATIALPITDDSGALVGIVTHDDAMDVASDEATDDFHKSGGVSTMVGKLKDVSIRVLYRKRVFWLVFFLPLLVDSGGNAGSQSATLMVRALAIGDVVMRDWFSLLGREALVALMLGATMAVAISIIGYVRGDAVVSLVLALSMMSVVMIGWVIGMSLPFVLNKLGFDPATASAPLITSVCDASGVLIYLFIASRFLSIG